ncbi:MAG: glycosyltransferase [Methanotrichaceae archaeon]
MEFSVIIPTLNEENYIEDCIKSISSQTFPRDKYEIIVSDGSSEDRTVEIAEKYADIVVISKKKGIWWGRNYGAKFAKGKYLVFIDADTTIKEDYLEVVHKYLENGIVGLTMGFGIEGKGPKMRLIEYVSDYYWWLNSKIGNGSLIGINICVPKKIFMKIGGFKEYALEDAAFDKELRTEGQTLFLVQRKVVTSARRFEEYGAIGLCRYYFELGLLDSGKIGNPYIINFIKYRNYLPVRISKIKKECSRYERFKALCDSIHGFNPLFNNRDI